MNLQNIFLDHITNDGKKIQEMNDCHLDSAIESTPQE